MIIEKDLPNWNQKLRYEKHIYPQCSCNNCPRFYANYLFVGARQTGKTYSCTELVRHYEENDIIDEDGNKREIRVFLISPTVQANFVFTALKSLDMENDVYTDYDDNTLKEILDEIKRTKKESEDYALYLKAYKEYSKLPEDKLYKLDNEYLSILASKDFLHPSELEQPRYKFPPISLIILDDLLGSSCFNGKRTSFFQKQLIQNRHAMVSYMILTQSLKAVPKNIRLNVNVFYLCKFSNTKVVAEDIYEEVSNSITEDEFLEMYLHCIEDQYGALVIDLSGKKKRFFKGWKKEIFLK